MGDEETIRKILFGLQDMRRYLVRKIGIAIALTETVQTKLNRNKREYLKIWEPKCRTRH
jgi:hypothetical protein